VLVLLLLLLLLAPSVGTESIRTNQQRHVVMLAWLGLERDGAVRIKALRVHSTEVVLDVENEAAKVNYTS